MTEKQKDKKKKDKRDKRRKGTQKNKRNDRPTILPTYRHMGTNHANNSKWTKQADGKTKKNTKHTTDTHRHAESTDTPLDQLLSPYPFSTPAPCQYLLDPHQEVGVNVSDASPSDVNCVQEVYRATKDTVARWFAVTFGRITITRGDVPGRYLGPQDVPRNQNTVERLCAIRARLGGTAIRAAD